jgi:hypothetical protein
MYSQKSNRKIGGVQKGFMKKAIASANLSGKPAEFL